MFVCVGGKVGEARLRGRNIKNNDEGGSEISCRQRLPGHVTGYQAIDLADEDTDDCFYLLR